MLFAYLNYQHQVRIVNFVTWSRMVGLEIRLSILDYTYVKDPTKISELESFKPYFRDHSLALR